MKESARFLAPCHQPRSPSRPRTGQVLYWIALAFIPSSLMLGVTTYLTTDIAAVPLLVGDPSGDFICSRSFSPLPGGLRFRIRG